MKASARVRVRVRVNLNSLTEVEQQQKDPSVLLIFDFGSIFFSESEVKQKEQLVSTGRGSVVIFF